VGSLVSALRSALLRRPATILLTLLLGVALALPAAAEPSSEELRSELERAEARLQEIHMELAEAVEDYNEASVALRNSEAELFVSQQELEAVSGEVANLSEAAEDHVRRVHKLGPSLELSAIFVAGNPTDAGAKAATLRRVLAGQRSDLEGLAAARTTIAALEERLDEQRAEAAANAEAFAEQRDAVEAMVEARQGEITQLEAEIQEAVEREEEERRRREEEERLRREAEERARQQAEEEARQRAAAEAQAEEVARQRAAERAARDAEEQTAAQERDAEERSAEQRQAEERAAQQQQAEERAAQERQAEERAAEERAARERAAREEAAQERRAESSSSNSGSSGGSGGNASGGNASGGDASGGNASGGNASGGDSGGSSAPAPSTRRSAQVAVDTAVAQVGKPYQWGANGPNSFDCSGLTSFAWRAAGVDITRTSRSQYAATKRVSRADLQPGDLVFYSRSGPAGISHVAMYIGNGRVVEASRAGVPVRISDNGLGRSDIIGYGRP
jgi:peptidoglycan DL-endopeptidase CwlO